MTTSAMASPSSHWRQLPRFLVTGALNTAVSYGTYLVLLPISGYHIAYVLAFLSGLFLSLILNLKWVFRVPPSWGRALLFPLVYAPQLLLGLAVNHGLIDALGVDPKISVLLVIAMSVPLNYLIARRILKCSATISMDAR